MENNLLSHNGRLLSLDDYSHCLDFLTSHPEYKQIQEADDVQIELKYASCDNFMEKNVYGSFNRVFLHKIAFDQFKKAQLALKTEAPLFTFRIYDALRPARTQWQLWKCVAGTPQERYVANPHKGSIHSYGFAIDLTIVDSQSNPLDMGTAFDEFTELSQPQLEREFLEAGLLSKAQIQNRALLRNCMTQAQFIQLPHEWWHFDALSPDIVREKYFLIE